MCVIEFKFLNAHMGFELCRRNGFVGNDPGGSRRRRCHRPRTMTLESTIGLNYGTWILISMLNYRGLNILFTTITHTHIHIPFLVLNSLQSFDRCCCCSVGSFADESGCESDMAEGIEGSNSENNNGGGGGSNIEAIAMLSAVMLPKCESSMGGLMKSKMLSEAVRLTPMSPTTIDQQKPMNLKSEVSEIHTCFYTCEISVVYSPRQQDRTLTKRDKSLDISLGQI